MLFCGDSEFVRCIEIPICAWSCTEAMMKSSGLSGSACPLGRYAGGRGREGHVACSRDWRDPHRAEVIGREREIAVVSAFPDSVPRGPRALLVEGEAGIGKSMVWLEAVRLAEARGYRVLRARPAGSEAKLSYAALADVIGPAFDEARAQLPHPQKLALAAALLRVTSSEPADPRTVATAVVGVLTELVREQPVLMAIDDVQWLIWRPGGRWSSRRADCRHSCGCSSPNAARVRRKCRSSSTARCLRTRLSASSWGHCRWRRCITSCANASALHRRAP
jgi:uncharacterized protein (DUF2267 family)